MWLYVESLLLSIQAASKFDNDNGDCSGSFISKSDGNSLTTKSQVQWLEKGKIVARHTSGRWHNGEMNSGNCYYLFRGCWVFDSNSDGVWECLLIVVFGLDDRTITI